MKTEPKFTRGEWRAGPTTKGGNDDWKTTFYADQMVGVLIAGGAKPFEQAKADAELIESAPRMFDTIEKIKAAIAEFCLQDGDISGTAVIARLGAIIEKAGLLK